MRKASYALLIGLLLSGCSYNDLLALVPTPIPPPPTATATVYVTPTETASLTPTQPTPTFTTTPTLIYLNGTPLPSATLTPPSTLYVVPTITATIEALSLSLQGNGPFTAILVPGKQLFWGSCDPHFLKVAVKVADSVPAAGVLIELRLQDVKTGDHTEWGGGAIMEPVGDGVFSYTLLAASFEHYRDYPKAWGQYQFVAYNYTPELHRLSASGQFLKSLVIQPCP
jgi:hypothetical protein